MKFSSSLISDEVTKPAESVLTLTFIRPDDCHVHLRDHEILKEVLPHTAKQFARAVVMPNLTPPLLTTTDVLAYRLRILAALDSINGDIDLTSSKAPSSKFSPLMTIYLTDNTSSKEILQAKESGFILGAKLYPAGATTNSSQGVTDISRCSLVLELMQKIGMPLLVHGEVNNLNVDIFDREKIFIDTTLEKLRNNYPELKIVLEHITTKEAVDYVNTTQTKYKNTLSATITAHHLLFNRNSMFFKGLQPHYYCLPVLKREVHRQALLTAAASGKPYFFLGTDSAPHLKNSKENSCSCAGCYTAMHALELYVTAFEQINALDKFEAFASFYGADFYGLERNTGTVTLTKSQTLVPKVIKLVSGGEIVPLSAGEKLYWKMQDRGSI